MTTEEQRAAQRAKWLKALAALAAAAAGDHGTQVNRTKYA